MVGGGQATGAEQIEDKLSHFTAGCKLQLAALPFPFNNSSGQQEQEATQVEG